MKRHFTTSTYLTLVIHVAVCLAILWLPFYFKPERPPMPVPDTFPTRGNTLNFIHVLFIGFFYLNAYFLIPELLSKRKKIVYGFSIIITFLLIFLISNLISPMGGNRVRVSPSFFLMAPFIFTWAVSTAYRFFIDKLSEDKLLRDQENENLRTELSFLRSQISPHFMFNTLNSLVSLARKKSDELEPILIKLSSLIRYMLYESESMVSLETETEYLENYIELQRLRFGDRVEIKYQKQLGRNAHHIEPMILISFVENAFKHGMGMISNPKIDIHLQVDNKELHFSVWNRHNNRASEMKDQSSGIGLPNIKRRLNILYGSNHHLTLINNDDWFMTTLKLKLK